jgi:hypothetical protein
MSVELFIVFAPGFQVQLVLFLDVYLASYTYFWNFPGFWNLLEGTTLKIFRSQSSFWCSKFECSGVFEERRVILKHANDAGKSKTA